MHPLCQNCGENPAVVFITQMADDQSLKVRLCEACARQKALGEGWFSQLVEEWSDEANLSDEVREALEAVPLEQIMLELFDNGFDGALSADENFETSDAFDDDFEFDSETHPPSPAAPFEVASGHLAVLRCPNCHTTWDKIRHDGRAGCAGCYEAFREQLGEVMARVQRGAAHDGKAPRAAQKRARRQDNLRARQQHQLELLQNRLKDAVASENYEEAAKLRDKIKVIGEK